MRVLFIMPYFLVLLLAVISISCRKVHTYSSKSIVVSRITDQALKDSALLYGLVYSAIDEKTPEVNSNIWIEGTNIKTVSDTNGYFSLKLLPGKFTIKCIGQYSNQNMTGELKNLTILPNEKVEVKFIQGIIVE